MNGQWADINVLMFRGLPEGGCIFKAYHFQRRYLDGNPVLNNSAIAYYRTGIIEKQGPQLVYFQHGENMPSNLTELLLNYQYILVFI